MEFLAIKVGRRLNNLLSQQICERKPFGPITFTTLNGQWTPRTALSSTGNDSTTVRIQKRTVQRYRKQCYDSIWWLLRNGTTWCSRRIFQMHTLIATSAASYSSPSPTDIQTPAMSPSCEKHTTAQSKVADNSKIKSPPTSAPPG